MRGAISVWKALYIYNGGSWKKVEVLAIVVDYADVHESFDGRDRA